MPKAFGLALVAAGCTPGLHRRHSLPQFGVADVLPRAHWPGHLVCRGASAEQFLLLRAGARRASVRRVPGAFFLQGGDWPGVPSPVVPEVRYFPWPSYRKGGVARLAEFSCRASLGEGGKASSSSLCIGLDEAAQLRFCSYFQIISCPMDRFQAAGATIVRPGAFGACRTSPVLRQRSNQGSPLQRVHAMRGAPP